jgi:hypothetical protein
LSAPASSKAEALGHSPGKLDEASPPLDRCLDVEEDELVRSRVRIGGAEIHRIADVAETFEAHSLDDTPRGDVQTGDQAWERHRSR